MQQKIPIKNAKIWKTGGSYVVTIPSDYINNGQIDVDKEYNLDLEVAE